MYREATTSAEDGPHNRNADASDEAHTSVRLVETLQEWTIPEPKGMPYAPKCINSLKDDACSVTLARSVSQSTT